MPQTKPSSLVVFGILHLVFAGFGVLSAIWGLFIAIAGNPFLKLAGNAGANEQLKTQLALQEKTAPMTITSSILTLIVAIPMIIAGIQLLRSRRNAIQWSNRYAFCSIGAKIVNLILTLTIMLPALQEMTRGITANNSSVNTFMNTTMAGGAIFGIVMTCVYPILTLALLNRPAPKTWINSQPA